MSLVKVMFSDQLEKPELEFQQTICKVSAGGLSKESITKNHYPHVEERQWQQHHIHDQYRVQS